MRVFPAKSHFALLAAFPVAMACTGGSPATGQNTQEHPGDAYYAQYCATCHGADMTGGMASSLVDGQWEFGGSREEIYRSIADGIEDQGMPAYRNALDERQINLIVDAIEGVEYVPVSTAMADEPEDYDVLETLDYDVRVEVWVGEGIEVPWGIAFLDESRALVTERAGPVRLIEDGELHPDPIEGTPPVAAGGQGGMLAVSTHPDYEENGWIYLAYSHGLEDDGTSGPRQTRVVRGRIQDHRWVDQEVVYQAPEESYTTSTGHFGTRVVFDEDGYLYFAIGDRRDLPSSQRLDSPNGKVHRLYDDGTVPEDNPFVDDEDALDTIYTYGHRNQQGMDFYPLTGDLWTAEHGPRGGDEINIIRAGKNYGWPEITYGIHYDGRTITRERFRPGIEPPVWVWRPSTALCAIDFYTGDEFPLWRNHLLATALRNEDLRLLQVRNDRIIHEEVILEDRGRIRDVATGPDGAIYLLTSRPHQILRLTAIEEILR